MHPAAHLYAYDARLCRGQLVTVARVHVYSVSLAQVHLRRYLNSTLRLRGSPTPSTAQRASFQIYIACLIHARVQLSLMDIPSYPKLHLSAPIRKYVSYFYNHDRMLHLHSASQSCRHCTLPLDDITSPRLHLAIATSVSVYFLPLYNAYVSRIV